MLPNRDHEKATALQGGSEIVISLSPRQLAAIDTWAAANGHLSRASAVDALIDRGLGQSTHLMRSS